MTELSVSVDRWTNEYGANRDCAAAVAAVTVAAVGAAVGAAAVLCCCSLLLLCCGICCCGLLLFFALAVISRRIALAYSCSPKSLERYAWNRPIGCLMLKFRMYSVQYSSSSSSSNAGYMDGSGTASRIVGSAQRTTSRTRRGVRPRALLVVSPTLDTRGTMQG